MEVELYDWEGVLLGKAQDWIWPCGERAGLLKNLSVPANKKDRFDVMSYDQAPVTVRQITEENKIYLIAGRISEIYGEEQRDQDWRIDEVMIVVSPS